MAHIHVCFLFALLLGCAFGQNDEENDDQYVDWYDEGGEDDPGYCYYVVADKCPNDFLRLSPLPDEAFFLDHCDDILKLVQCQIDANETCRVEDRFVEPLKSYEALKSLAVDICNKESSFRKSYLSEVDCINSHEDDLIRDRTDHFILVDKFLKHHNLMYISDDDDLLQTMRCAKDLFSRYRVKIQLQFYCGEEAAALFDDVLDRIFEYNAPPCSTHADDVQHYFNLLKEYEDQIYILLSDPSEQN